MQKVIGICGISQSGKSTLAGIIQNELTDNGIKVEVFEIDKYTKPKERIPRISDRINWEDPESVDWVRLLRAIKKSTADIIIVEGIFAFQPELLSLINITILLEVTKEKFMERRQADKRWGEEPRWYLEHVWKSNQWLLVDVKPDLTIANLESDNLKLVFEHLSINYQK